MQSKVENVKKIVYPCLMELNKLGDQFVVLFVEQGCGTIVNITSKGPSCSHKLGQYHGDWHTALFTKFDGTVTLSN